METRLDVRSTRRPVDAVAAIARTPHTVSYACAGGLIAAGAPLGLLAVRWLQQPDFRGAQPTLRSVLREVSTDVGGYLYVSVSTAVVFAWFGYLLGRQADRLQLLSETDPLTGLYNARGLLARVETELARCRRYHQPVALLLVDLDGLKQINDRYGHQAGDTALVRLAEVIRSQLRETDVAARWGGDEFAILAPQTSHASALALAERIRVRVPGEGPRAHITASLGVVATEPRMAGTAPDATMLMRLADAALYQAKRSGRNTVAGAAAVPMR
jgi:diguanylate cyclase (GGDEF)-like protein